MTLLKNLVDDDENAFIDELNSDYITKEQITRGNKLINQL